MCKFLIIFKVLEYMYFKKEEKITNYDNNKLKMRKSLLLLLCLKLKRCSIKCDNILFLILFIYYIQHL